MSFTRQDIQNIIARNKKKNSTSKSPSSPVSTKILQGNRTTSPKDVTHRYNQLCTKYKQLLEEVKDKNKQFQLQEIQMERLRIQKERDQKQIYRLRSMIGFIKKQEKGLQVNMDMQSAGSWSTKIEKSTTIQNQYDTDWNIPLKQSYSSKILRKISPQSKDMNKTTNNKNQFQQAKLYKHQLSNDFSRLKTQSIYSPKVEKHSNTFYKIKQSTQFQTKVNKLSNSPYSKLRFSRKLDK